MAGPHADLFIRAVRGWAKPSGVEAPHVTLSDKQRSELSQLAEIIDIKNSASLIFAQGEGADFIYLVASGVVRTCHLLKNGERQVMAFLWPGDLFGLASEGKYVDSAESVAPSKIYRFPIVKLQTFLIANPILQSSFLAKAVHDLRNAQRQLLVMGRLDIPRRLAAFLLDCSGHERYFDAGKQILTLPMSRNDIADYLGTSAETITRALNRLSGDDLVVKLSSRKFVLARERLKTFIDLD